MKWTDEEEKFLKENYEDLEYKEIAEKLDRTTSAVKSKVSDLNLIKFEKNSWSKEEEDFLKENYKKYTAKKLGEILGRSSNSIRNKKGKMDLTSSESRWSEEEVNFLKGNYHDSTYGEIGEKLGRSYHAVRRKAQRIENLEKVRNWTNEEKRIMKENYGEKSSEQISNMIDRTVEAIRSKAKEMGLSKKLEKWWLKDEFHECSKCGKAKLIDKFPKLGGDREGRCTWCKECVNEHSKDSYRKIKEFTDDLKDRPCERCGKKFPPCVMEFHHFKDDGNNRLISDIRNKKRVLEEIKKCRLFCANCHRIVEHFEK